MTVWDARDLAIVVCIQMTSIGHVESGQGVSICPGLL